MARPDDWPPGRGAGGFSLSIPQPRYPNVPEQGVGNTFTLAALLGGKETQKGWNVPMKKIITATGFAVLLTAAPAFAADTSTDNKPASSTSSGPGVKGAPGNKSGPAAKSDKMDNAGSSSSTGGAATQPSQDAKGVKGAPGNKSGPAEKPNSPEK